MTTYVVITEHPPQLCQTSNKVCGELFAQVGPALEHSDEIPGFKMVLGPLITSDHRSFLVAEVDHYDLLRKFIVQSRSVQWNAVTSIPVISYDEALAELDMVEPLFMTHVPSLEHPEAMQLLQPLNQLLKGLGAAAGAAVPEHRPAVTSKAAAKRPAAKKTPARKTARTRQRAAR